MHAGRLSTAGLLEIQPKNPTAMIMITRPVPANRTASLLACGQTQSITRQS